MNWRDMLVPGAETGGFDLFLFFRWWLTVVCLIYALIVTIRALLAWIDFLSQPHRMMGVLRHYLLVQLLRLRLRRFRAELLRITAWTVVLMLVIRAHGWIGG